jgi:ubiquinone/menaquinone biosynthesis C-methylase UbiE
VQYSKTFTDALQFMWGTGFLSPGGPDEVADMLRGQPVAGSRVLDIGSGLGGVDLLLVERHGAGEVVGIDVEGALVSSAHDLVSSAGLQDRIRFELVEPGALPFPDRSFDLVFSKDAMVHIEDKPALYREVMRVLRPGGAFLASDWLWAEGAATNPVVQDWLSKGPLRFAFTTLPEAEAALCEAGFTDVCVEDRRALLQASNRREVEALEGPARQRLAQIVGEEMAMSRLIGAKGRQAALDTGNLIPSHLKGTKPD